MTKTLRLQNSIAIEIHKDIFNMKPREPHSVESATDETVRIFGGNWHAVGEAIGKGHSLIRKWSDSTQGGTPLLKQALTLDKLSLAMSGQAPFYDFYTRELENIRSPEHAAQLPLMRLAHVVEEVGDVGREIRNARCPHGEGGGQITPGESLGIRTQIEAVRKALDALEKDVETHTSGNLVAVAVTETVHAAE